MAVADSRTLARQIDTYCAANGISKSEFSQRTGVSSATLSQWRKGVYEPSEKSVLAIENYMSSAKEQLPTVATVDASEEHLTPSRTYTIYAIRNSINGRIYIGSTIDLHVRLSQHFTELKRGDKTKRIGRAESDDGHSKRINSTWQDDYNEAGRDAFKCYVLQENVLKNEQRKTENEWILKYRANEPEYGYNIRPALHRKPKTPIENGLPPLPED